MHYTGDVSVLDNLWLKKRAMENGEPHNHLRIAGFVGAGVLRGVVGAGMGRPLERLGFTQTFDHCFGSSTGAASLPFFLSGQLEKEIGVYWNEAASKEFIALAFPGIFNRIVSGRPVQDTEYLCGVFRRKLNQDAVRRSRTELYFGVTCAETGEGHFLDAKTIGPDLVEGIRASISIPGICGGAVRIGGRLYYDGAGAMGLPARKIVEKVQPTDLLIFANRPPDIAENPQWNVLMGLLTAKCSSGVQRAFCAGQKEFDLGLYYLKTHPEVRSLILWTDESIKLLERDPQKLRDAADRGDRLMERLLQEARQRVESKQLQAAE